MCSADENPINWALGNVYRPIAAFILRLRIVVTIAALAMVATVPILMRLGSEFMAPLDEAAPLDLPTMGRFIMHPC